MQTRASPSSNAAASRPYRAFTTYACAHRSRLSAQSVRERPFRRSVSASVAHVTASTTVIVLLTRAGDMDFEQGGWTRVLHCGANSRAPLLSLDGLSPTGAAPTEMLAHEAPVAGSRALYRLQGRSNGGSRSTAAPTPRSTSSPRARKSSGSLATPPRHRMRASTRISVVSTRIFVVITLVSVVSTLISVISPLFR